LQCLAGSARMSGGAKTVPAPSLLIGNVGILGICFSGLEKSFAVYESGVVLARAASKELRTRGAHTLVTGSDSHVDLPPNLEPWTGPHAVGRTCGRVADRADRRGLFLALLNEFSLCVSSSWLATAQRWTRAPVGRQRGTCRQIDHICVSQGVRAQSVILGTAMQRFDRRPVFTLSQGRDLRVRARPWKAFFKG